VFRSLITAALHGESTIETSNLSPTIYIPSCMTMPPSLNNTVIAFFKEKSLWYRIRKTGI